MANPLTPQNSSLAPKLTAPQHKPRPLPLFLQLLRNETKGNPARTERALAGLRAYQEAARPSPPEPGPVIAAVEGVHLRDYGGEGRPVLFVPSLINPPNVLDLEQERSLLRWLAARGHRVLLADWGTDSMRRRDVSVAGHVTDIIVPLIAAIAEPPVVVGYCLGGTMAAAAAAVAHVRGLVTMAAPWHFSHYSEEARDLLSKLWAASRSPALTLGVLPMEVLQSAFWSLDPGRTVGKFEAFSDMDPASGEARAFVTLEDWANDGPPITCAAAEEIFDSFFRDDLPGRGQWTVSDRRVDLAELECPQLHIHSSGDKIVPQSSCPKVGEMRIVEQGHVGMIVGRHARAALWEPLDAWLSRISAEW